MEQFTFASLTPKKKGILRAEKFLEEMEKVIPWKELLKLIEPHYYLNKRGRQAHPLLLMVKIHFLQQWYNLADLAIEEAIYDRLSFQKFLKLDLMRDRVPDETTILNFRHLLEEKDLASMIFRIINRLLEEEGLLMKQGTIVDATIMRSPTSTKNKEHKRDPEMKSTKKNNEWFFGFKAHIGADMKGGLVHSLEVTNAKVSDREKFFDLLHGEEEAVLGDKGYVNKKDKKQAREAGIFWGILDRGSRVKKLSKNQNKRNQKLSRVRAKVEHPFRIIKDLWGHRKTRYRGLKKNRSKMYLLFSLSNLYMARKGILQRA